MKQTLCIAAALFSIGLALISTPSHAQLAASNFNRPGNGSWHGQNRGPGVQWSGRVDGTVNIWFQDTKSWVDVKSGNPLRHFNYNFSRPLPQAEVNVDLVNESGRGNVYVFQQPNRGNGYIAGVRIEDPQPGRGDYNFSLQWHRNR